ncbi:MAG: OadG family transporter subunit [Oscillochloridaceae bacterium]|nr:OadG family transporter subunit [Chloroflexaceae bacterium]MDW8390902.1 OadG family transporter subunit [Oscillochloridaceae bacterium]
MTDLWFGIQITIYGMGLVFALLALLWGLLALLVWLDERWRAPAAAPEGITVALEEVAETRGAQVRGAGVEELAPETLAAIAAAVLAHAAREQPGEITAAPPESPAEASRWVAAGRIRQTTRAVQRRRG